MAGSGIVPPAFVSYSRDDSGFALRLVKDLTAAGANVWLDQVNLAAGQRWDRAIEIALTSCGRMLVILSPASVASENVMDEISFAIDERKEIIPVLYGECTVPLRLRRFQNIDFRGDYERGLEKLLKTMGLGLEQADFASVNEGDAMADQGDLCFFGKGVPQDYKKAREWYEKGAAAGSAKAMYYLGNMYDHAQSYFGEECDWKAARAWYEKSAAAGHADAMAMLGWHYDRGISGDEDSGKAFYWYQKAAAAGSGYGMAGLGELYADGRGVVEDAAKAQQWFEKGAEAGNGEAMARLGNLHYRRARDAHFAANNAPSAVRGAIKADYEKARLWLEKGMEAAACNVDAVSDLALLYRHGYGVEKNEQTADMWDAMYSTICDCIPGQPRRLTMIRYF
jgi:TPR repeat protein